MRTVTAGALSLALLAGCGGGGTVGAEDLATVALRPEEAPEGSVLSEERSGPQTLDDFAGSAPELEAQGFQGAYSALYGPEDGHGHAHDDAPFVANFLAVFDSAEGAEWSFGEYRSRFSDGSFQELPADDLGEEAFAIRGEPNEASGGRPWMVISWRTGNLHAYLSLQGEVSDEEALDMARSIDERADSVAG